MSRVDQSGRITLRFHGELLDFFHADQAPHRVVLDFKRPPSLKDAVESAAPPHAEVGLILHGDRAHALNDLLEPDAAYDIYPHHSHPKADPTRLQPLAPPGRPRFILDVHLGVLARYLRMLGFDTWYQSRDPGDARIAQIAGDESRIALSRDLGLLKRSVVRYGRWIRNTNAEEQLKEVVGFFQLQPHIQPFARCMNCNHPLEPVPKADVLDRLPRNVAQTYDQFNQCRGCDKVFWKGSHYQRLKPLIEEVQSDPSNSSGRGG